MFIFPALIAESRDCRAGRSREAPERPPSWAVPSGPGDRARDGGEAWVCRLAPYVPARDHSDGVALALVFAHEHGAGLEAPRSVGSSLAAARQPVQELRHVRIEPAEGLLLDMPADKPCHEVVGERWRRGRPQC